MGMQVFGRGLSTQVVKHPVVNQVAKQVLKNARSILFAGQLATVAMLSACSSLPNAYEGRLADHLTETGAKMYGAYWCPHCARQKQAFGGGVDRIPYVECDPEGFNSQAELCWTEGIEAYPTWIINGERYLGVQPLGKLADLSGFESGSESDGEEVPTDSDLDAAGGYSTAE